MICNSEKAYTRIEDTSFRSTSCFSAENVKIYTVCTIQSTFALENSLGFLLFFFCANTRNEKKILNYYFLFISLEKKNLLHIHIHISRCLREQNQIWISWKINIWLMFFLSLNLLLNLAAELWFVILQFYKSVH
jgi:hypothetical protein